MKPAARLQPIILGFIVAGGIFSPARATAQTEPIPLLPPPELTPPPTADPGQQRPAPVAALYADTRIRPWEYGLALGAGWQDNVEFASDAAAGDYTGVLLAGLSRFFRGPRGRLTITGVGTGQVYQTLDQFNRANALADINGLSRLSTRTRISMSAGFAYSHSVSSRILGDQGVLLPLVRTKSYRAAVGLTRQLGRRSTLRLGARGLRVEFDSDDLVNGDSLRLFAGLGRRFGRRDALSLAYSIERARGRSDIDTQFGSLQWTHNWRRTALLLEGGASYTEQVAAAELERPWSFFGGVSLNRQLRRSSLTVFYRREVIPVFGFGTVRLTDRVGLRASMPLGQRWGMYLDGIYVADRSGQSSPSRLRSAQASVSLGGALGRWVGASITASYRRRSSSDGTTPVEGYAAGVFLTVGNGGPNTRLYRGRVGRAILY